MVNEHFFKILFLFVFAISCSVSGNEPAIPEVENSSVNPVKKTQSDSTQPVLSKHNDTVIFLKRNKDSIRVELKFPKNILGNCLILHGWNLPSEELCAKTKICSVLLDSGYVLIIPDFGRTTYQWQNYPQTRKDYLKYPTRSWMQDTFIISLQNQFGLLQNEGRNFVYGVSTGGRGAALLALENPRIFKAAACLSADFDHFALGDEPINVGYYGKSAKYPDRWKGRDNIHNRASEFKSGLYMAHGSKDKVCPVSQTEKFMEKLKEVNDSIRTKYVIDTEGDHTYIWWDKQTVPIVQFFDEF